MQRLLKIPVIRNHLYSRAVEKFMKDQTGAGVTLRGEDVIKRLSALRTLLIDAPMIMEGYDAVRRVLAPMEMSEPARLKHQSSWMVLTTAISLCCDGSAPLEELAREMNFAPDRMAGQYPQVDRLPLSETHDVETTIHRDMGGLRAYTRGSTAAVLSKCVKVLDGRERVMTAEDMRKILSGAADMEEEGLCALAFATRWLKEPGAYEEDMVFLGVVGMGDLPHVDAPWAMDALRGAAVRPVLVASGDMLPGAIAASGALHGEAGAMRVEEMNALDDDALAEATEHADAFLGIDRRHGERLAQALRRDGEVAMLRGAADGGMLLTFDGGMEPDVTFAEEDIRALVRLLGDCRALTNAYSAQSDAKR